jgi:transposase-like protein
MGSRQAGSRERRTFSAEFKIEAVRVMQERRSLGGPLAQISRELGLRPEQLRDWEKRAGMDRRPDPSRPGETLEQENRRLRRELAVARQEQAFAKNESCRRGAHLLP